MQTDVQYWNKYYEKKRAEISEPSAFALFCALQMKHGKMLIDLGCGNGRDSFYFCKKRLKVTAVDSSQTAIDAIESMGLPLFAVCNDFINTKALDCIDYDYAYARWAIHSISQKQQDELLPRVFCSLNRGGLFFIEARTINDAKYGDGVPIGENEFFFDNHYRRFVVPDIFLSQMKEVGFSICYSEESDRFSVMRDDSPTLLRVVGLKP